MSSKLATLQEKKAQIEAQIKNEQQKENSRRRKLETRLKILAGAFAIHKAEKENSLEQFINELDLFITKERDKNVLTLLREKLAIKTPTTIE
jgi:hypothetical protein